MGISAKLYMANTVTDIQVKKVLEERFGKVSASIYTDKKTYAYANFEVEVRGTIIDIAFHPQTITPVGCMTLASTWRNTDEEITALKVLANALGGLFEPNDCTGEKEFIYKEGE